MTPRSVQVGLVRWCRVTSTNAITGRAVALTLASARAALPCGPDEAVVSAASYALGTPRGARLAAVTVDPAVAAAQQETRRRNVAAATRAYKRRQQKAKHDRKPDRRAAKTAWQRAVRMQSRIANGVKRRREKRGAA